MDCRLPKLSLKRSSSASARAYRSPTTGVLRILLLSSVNCTLTLLKSSIRKTPVVGDRYARADAEDDRFSDNFGSLQSIVTSSAQNDSGLFETNLRDERYLPFENSGVISEWQLQLPADPSKNDPRQFDYDTISDVILHIRYTSRGGGGLLSNGAIRR